MSIRSICLKHNLTFAVVRRRLKDNGVELRGYDYPKSKEHIEKMNKNRVIRLGVDNPCYKPLSNEEIAQLKHLRFVEGKTIHEIMKIMKINQNKYYDYINK